MLHAERAREISQLGLCRGNKMRYLFIFCHLECHELSFREQRNQKRSKTERKLKNGSLGSHLKVEKVAVFAPGQSYIRGEGSPLVSSQKSIVTPGERLFSLCSSQHPTLASAMSSGMFVRLTPVSGTNVGPLPRTKQMMEMSHSGTKDLKETCPPDFSVPMTSEHNHLGIPMGNVILSFLHPWANIQEFVIKMFRLQFMSQMEMPATSVNQNGPHIYLANFFSK